MERLIDVLCIGAHPDDVEIGMGGTVAGMVRRGQRVAIADLTDGEPTPMGSPAIRAAESARSAAMLGVERRVLLSGTNRFLTDSFEARTELAELIRELRPTTLFIPYPDDAHPDHVAAHSLCVAARFMAKLTKTEMSGEPWFPRRIYRYAAVHRRIDTPASFLVDIGEDLPAKMAALACYESQFVAHEPNRGMLDVVERRARYMGDLAGCEAAEPFYAFEPVALARPEDLL